MSGDYATSASKQQQQRAGNRLSSNEDAETDGRTSEEYPTRRRGFPRTDGKYRQSERVCKEIYCNIKEHVASLRTIFWLYLQRKVKRRIAKRKKQLLQRIGDQSNVRNDSFTTSKATAQEISKEKSKSSSSVENSVGLKSSERNTEFFEEASTNVSSHRNETKIKDSTKRKRRDALLTGCFVLLLGASTYLLQHGNIGSGWFTSPAPVKPKVNFFGAPVPVIKDNAVKIFRWVLSTVDNVSERISATDAWSRSNWEKHKNQFKSEMKPDPGAQQEPKTTFENEARQHEYTSQSKQDLEEQPPPTMEKLKKSDPQRKRWPKNPFQKIETDDKTVKKKKFIGMKRSNMEDELNDRASWLFAGSGITDLVDTLSTIPYAPTDLFRNPAVDWMKVLWKYVMSWVGCSLSYAFGYL